MNGSSTRWAPLRALMLVGLIAVWRPATPLLGQTPASQTLSRYRVEAYFADSLQHGAQRVINTEGATTQIAAANAIPRDVILATRVASEAVVDPPTATGDRRVVLPDRAFVETIGGIGMLLVPVVIVEGRGLRYSNGAFRGSIRVGLEDSLSIGSSVALPSPIRFFVTGTADSIQRPDTAVIHTNLPFTPINIVQGARMPTVTLNVRTTLHPGGVDVDVPVVLDTLRIAASPPRVQGMGLEETILMLGAGPFADGTAIQLSADNGGLADDEVRLSPAGTARTSLRSYWFGPSTVTARSIAFADAQISVDFAFPWLFLAASLLGGAIGGLAAWLQKRQAEVSWIFRVTGGALLGLIAAVLYAVGVNVTPFSPGVSTGQAVVFALAAVIGYVGALRIPGAASMAGAESS